MSNQQKRRIVVFVILAGIIVLSTATICSMAHLKNTVNQTAKMVQPIHKEEIQEMTNENLTEETVVKLRDSWTVAAFGLDSRESDNMERGNSDVIMLITMDGKTGAVKLASVYRDTCLKTGERSYKKANAAYASGGPKQAVAMLNENLDLRIDDYIAVNWKSVAEAINLLGGIDLSVTDREFMYLNSFITETVKSTGIPSVHLKHAGMNHLDGVQAVAYCRLRLMDDDFKRTERQQKVLNLVLKQASEADFATLNQLIVTILPQVASSIDPEDLYAVAKNITRLHIAGTTGFPENRFVKTVDGASYVFPTNLADSVSDLHLFLYGTEEYEPSSQVKEIGAAIQKKSRRNTVRTIQKPTPAPTVPIETPTETQEEMTASLPEEENVISMQPSENAATTEESKAAEEIQGTEKSEENDISKPYDPGYGLGMVLPESQADTNTPIESSTEPIGPGKTEVSVSADENQKEE